MTNQTDFITGYSPAPESTNHIEIKERYPLFINGKFSEPQSENIFPLSIQQLKKNFQKWLWQIRQMLILQ